MYRIGQGYDVHQLQAKRKLIIGGVEIPFEKGLMGHSDADVLIHAIIDAMLGALSLGDIGSLFPDTDAAYKNADSMVLLHHTQELLSTKGWHIVNIDSTIIAEKPKLRPYIDLIRSSLVNCLGIGMDCMSVKAKTNEKLGYLGNSEAIEAQAVVLMTRLFASKTSRIA